MRACIKNLTSIVISIEHPIEIVERCLNSIEKFSKSPFELILIYDGKDQNITNNLVKKSNIKLIIDHTPNGFIHNRNVGAKIASGDVIIFLQDNSVVAPNWMEHLRECLFSSEQIGAAAPVTNAVSYYQKIYTNCRNITEWLEYANQFNLQTNHVWQDAQKLDRFCFAVKSQTLQNTGYFDEAYGPIGFEDNDMSIRIMEAGFQLKICKDTFVYCDGYPQVLSNGMSYSDSYIQAREVFFQKWKFDPSYSMITRYDLIAMMTEIPAQAKILEIGCGSGATLMSIHQQYPDAKLYGVELSEGSSYIAKMFANVFTGDIEKLDLNELFVEELFDYIICGDVLEHLVDPWKVIQKLRNKIKDGGYLLISIPNIMHVSIVQSLLLGNWTYQSSGILDRTHLRFFTLDEIKKIFIQPDYYSMEYQPQPVGISPEQRNLIKQLSEWDHNYKTEQMNAYQYRIKAKVCHHSLEK